MSSRKTVKKIMASAGKETGRNMCYQVAWQGFDSTGGIGVGYVRSCRKLPCCTIEPMPDASKMDLPLAKAKPISDGGSASGITYIRRGKKPW